MLVCQLFDLQLFLFLLIIFLGDHIPVIHLVAGNQACLLLIQMRLLEHAKMYHLPQILHNETFTFSGPLRQLLNGTVQLVLYHTDVSLIAFHPSCQSRPVNTKPQTRRSENPGYDHRNQRFLISNQFSHRTDQRQC